MDVQWTGTVHDMDASIHPADIQLQKTLNVVQNHDKSLDELIDKSAGAVAKRLGSYEDVVLLHSMPIERAKAQDILHTEEDTDSPEIVKVLLVLVYLCDEAYELCETASSSFFPKLLSFGLVAESEPEGVGGSTNQEAEGMKSGGGQVEWRMGCMVPVLQELSNFVDRCYAIVANLLCQLSALSSNDKDPTVADNFISTPLPPAYNALSSILMTLLTLDMIVEQNPALTQGWIQYKMLVAAAHKDPCKFGYTPEDLKPTGRLGKLERLLVQLDQGVLSGGIFQGCIDQDFEYVVTGGSELTDEANAPVTNNPKLLSHLMSHIKQMVANVLALVDTLGETHEREDLVGIFSLYALHRRLTPLNVQPDRKVYQQLWATQKQVPIVVLCGKLAFLPGEFLQRYAPLDHSKLKLDPQRVQFSRLYFLKALDQAFPENAKKMCLQALAWMSVMDDAFHPCCRHEVSPSQLAEKRGMLLVKGLSLATRLGNLPRLLLRLHLQLEAPLPATTLLPLQRCVETMKGIEGTFIRCASVISEGMGGIIRILALALVQLSEPTIANFESLSEVDSRQSGICTAVHIIRNVVAGSERFTFCRQSALAFCFSLLFGASIPSMGSEEKLKVETALKRMRIFSEWQMEVRKACDTSFLYWNQELFPKFVGHAWKQPTHAFRLQYIFFAYGDAESLLRSIVYDDNFEVLRSYEDSLIGTLQQTILEPLSRELETDLRLHIHTKIMDHMGTVNPKGAGAVAMQPFLHVPPIRVMTRVLHIKRWVEKYLEETFYNLTTVALHDWKTYADMRNLAQEKFGLVLGETYLPMGSLDASLDVLQIMRNIHVFVSRFGYNLHRQNFIERRPDKGSKHLNTISTASIAASIRQHGLGILNTTVNYTYQFLAQKFKIFSQFLYDDYIRSHLSKEHRWYAKNKAASGTQYPSSRAVGFAREIRRLGVSPEGRTFLDHFRALITEVGNALGYVRMVRTAGMAYCGSAAKFLPTPYSEIQFQASSEENSLSPEAQRAGKNLDTVLQTLLENFSQGSDYLKVLVEVFRSVLLGSDHAHLKNFYMIIPPLTLSWVDASIQAKDATFKSGRNRDAYYTDDGFAMGVAYILAILGQDSKYNSLNWSKSILTTYQKEQLDLQAKKESQEAQKKPKKSSSFSSFFGRQLSSSSKQKTAEEEAHHNLQISSQKVSKLANEHELLNYSLDGARVFFRKVTAHISITKPSNDSLSSNSDQPFPAEQVEQSKKAVVKENDPVLASS